MSRVYDSWEKLVGAVLDREELRRLALCDSFTTSNYSDHSSRFSFDSSAEPLPWATRTKVAIGAAGALAFLHGLETPVIHGAIKSSDILLDADFNAKLSNFGIVRYSGRIQQVIVPYIAPGCGATGCSTTRCDVFCFGGVLLELMSGLPVIDRMRPAEKRDLVKWETPYLKDKRRVWKVVDSRLMGEYPQEEACKLANIVLQCVSEDPSLRPGMSEVVAELQKLQ